VECRGEGGRGGDGGREWMIAMSGGWGCVLFLLYATRSGLFVEQRGMVERCHVMATLAWSISPARYAVPGYRRKVA